MLESKDIGHYYGSHLALEDISFTASAGVIGLLGRNGAGKTTLLRILATLMLPSSGELLFRDGDMLRNPERLRRASTYLPQDMGFPADVSALDYVNYLLALRGDPHTKSEFWLSELGLEPVMRSRLQSYSGGMRQRVALAYILACKADILLLDEPTQGLDPWERIRFQQHLAERAGQHLILFSTHIVSDIEAIASRVIVLDNGRICFDGTPSAMIGSCQTPFWTVTGATVPTARAGRTITAVRRLDSGMIEVRGVGSPPEGATFVPATLQDAYLYLTAGRPHDSAA